MVGACEGVEELTGMRVCVETDVATGLEACVGISVTRVLVVLLHAVQI
jgi:hypothetical protein